MRSLAPFLALLPLLAACSASSSSPSPEPAASPSATADAGPEVTSLHGTRYCEVLVANLSGDTVHVDVYNTEGLNDCPSDAWSALDANALASQLGATKVFLNGPRWWMLSGFTRAALLDPTVVTFGTIEMRKAGGIDLPVAQAMMLVQPYAIHTIHRETTALFAAGVPVFELVDDAGHVYEMQSYTTMIQPISEADLPGLASKLTLPAGWTYRTRTPSADLLVDAVDDQATVVQDDLGNTYQLSQ